MRRLALGGTLLATLLLALVCFGQIPTENIQSQAGIISVTRTSSCALESPGDCGSEGTSTELQFAIQPNSELFYQFDVLSDRDVLAPGNSGTCINRDENGVCLVTRPIQIQIVASSVVTAHGLDGISGLDVPFAYVSLHTDTYKRISNRDPDGDEEDIVTCAGRSDLFIAGSGGDDDTKFYFTPRVDSILMNSAGFDATVQASAENWGNTQEYVNAGLSPDVLNVCNNYQYPPNTLVTAASKTGRGRAFFDAPFVTATHTEANDDQGSWGCTNGNCCGTSAGSLGIPGTEPLCNDDSPCMERSNWCSLCSPFYGNYMGMDPWVTDLDPVGNFITNWDDNDDNDSCGDDDSGGANNDVNDDEHDDTFGDDQPTGICRVFDPDDDGLVLTCGLTSSQIQTVRDTYCDCQEDNDGDDIVCNPKCKAGDNTCSELDLNLNSKMGGGGTDPTNCRRFFCPFWEGRDDDNDDECGGTIGNAGKTCKNTCDAERRSYCGSACADKYMQELQGATPGTKSTKTNPACRFLAGSAFVAQPMYKCIDDGGDVDDNDNTGFNQTCYDTCMLDPSTCDLFEAGCFTDRPPLYDDCDDDMERKYVVNGPERVYWSNPLIIGLDGVRRSNHPNQENKWFSNNPRYMRPEPDDVSFGSADDVDFCSASGLGDQPDPNTSGDGQLYGTFVARCPACSCLAPINYQPDGGKFFKDVNDTTYVPQSFLCSQELFESEGMDANGINLSVAQRCNTPYPLYIDDADQEDGSRTRDDDMHPSGGAFYYKQNPVTLCGEGPKDRRGVMSLDHSATQFGPEGRGGQLRTRMHDTAEAIGLLGPYCHIYNIQKRPTPYIMLNITITDLSLDNALPTESIILMSYDETLSDGTSVNSQGTNSLNNVFAQFDNLASPSGPIGTDLDGLISICNATDHGDAGAPPTYNMGGDTSDPSAYFTNVWETIRQGDSIFHEGFGKALFSATDGKVENSNLVGLMPMSQILYNVPDSYAGPTAVGDVTPTVENRGSIKHGSFWYYVPPNLMNTYGHGCKQLGMTAQFFGNDANAATACSGNRHRCAPGYIEGFDWYYNQRRFDGDDLSATDNRLNTQQTTTTTSGKQGAYEDMLVKHKLTEYTPGVITGIMHKLLSTTGSCSSFVAQIDAMHNFLPPGWVQDAGDEKCGLPLWQLHNNKLIHFDPEVAAQTIFAEGRIVISNGILTGAGQPYSGGRILSIDVCVVGEASSNGHLGVSVQNVGTVESVYVLEANCTGNGVQSTGTDTETLTAGQVVQFNLPLSQFGVVTQGSQTFVCDLFLTSIQGIPLDSAQTTNCVISAANDAPFSIPANITVDDCTLYGVDCAAIGSGGHFGTGFESESNLLAVILLLGATITLMVTFWLCAYSSGNKYEQYVHLKLKAQQL